MAAIFQRRKVIKCFFCNSLVSNPRDSRNFRCPECTCWNRFDASGEIMSDEPAMHDEALNQRSFSRRGSPSKNRLINAYGKGPFCHSCQTNQMLLINLLSNYLPSPSSPEYERRLQMLPEYRESLHIRYPPVCDNCNSAVEEEIRRKDEKARSAALGRWLTQTRGKERERRVSGSYRQRETMRMEIMIWKLRGLLWAITLLLVVWGNITGALGLSVPTWMLFIRPWLPICILSSVLWTYWDPTYLKLRRAQLQGREVRLQGKNKYILLQSIALLSRFLSSILLSARYRGWISMAILQVYFYLSTVLELSILASIFLVLRLDRPPAIRLINTTTEIPSLRSTSPNSAEPKISSSATPLAVPEPDLFAALSFSSKPVMISEPKTNPVFGHPSLFGSSQMHQEGQPLDPNGMDWTPTAATSAATGSNINTSIVDDGNWMRPQRFFAPEQPTGLEDLFQKARLLDNNDRDVQMEDISSSGVRSLKQGWIGVSAALAVILGAVSYKLWLPPSVPTLQSVAAPTAMHDATESSILLF